MQPVNMKLIKEYGIWLEVASLIIPELTCGDLMKRVASLYSHVEEDAAWGLYSPMIFTSTRLRRLPSSS